MTVDMIIIIISIKTIKLYDYIPTTAKIYDENNLYN